MPKTTLQQLGEFGQSIWLDYISKPLVKSGKLQKLIDQGLLGMTSNPSIFNDSIGNLPDYDEAISQLGESGKTPFEIYDALTIKDIQDAADFFLPVYRKTRGLDGHVSLEINPKLAMNTPESITEGKRLFQIVNRPNVMIKVPATDPGFPVITELLSSGINVNVTLIFSLQQYVKTVEAFFAGMEALAKKGKDLSKVHSVASVFVSRIDTVVDKLLDEKILKESNNSTKAKMAALRGQAAVANSKLIFEKFGKKFSSARFKSLFKKKCPSQRVLWGSTGTKNPLYSDIKYVTELIANPTVNTLPEKTINAFLDHGVIEEAFTTGDISDAKDIVRSLNNFKIDVNVICQQLLADGVLAFEKAFDTLLSTIDSKAKTLCTKT